MSGYRVAVVGATGAVGTVMLGKLRERAFPAREVVPFASERSAGRTLRRRQRRPAAARGHDPGLRPRHLLRRRHHVGRVGAALRGRRLRGRGQLLPLAHGGGRPARRGRGQPARARAPPRADRQPELLDHAADGRAQADPRRRGDRAAHRLHLPVRVRHGRQGRGGAAGADGGRAGGRAAAAAGRLSASRSPSTSSAAPATSRTATTTRTKSAR